MVVTLAARATAFAGAFLFFIIEPAIARSILPTFGGTPITWIFVSLFFQMVILLGYSYGLVARGGTWHHRAAHAALLAAAVALLATAKLEQFSGQRSLFWLLLRLSAVLALPMALLSVATPILHQWLESRLRAGRAGYSLFAWSNLGSLCALLLYPTVVERVSSLDTQWGAFKVAFSVYAVGFAALLWWSGYIPPVTAAEPQQIGSEPVTARQRLSWWGFSAASSALLLALTSFVTADVAQVPLLFLAPLAVYLATYAAAFSQAPSVVRLSRYSQAPAMLGVVILLFVRIGDSELGTMTNVVAGLGAFGAVAWHLHSRLAHLQPAPPHAAEYYWHLSFGGLSGGAFVAIGLPFLADPALYHDLGTFGRAVGPLLFDGSPDLIWVLVIVACLVVRPARTPLRQSWSSAALVAIVLALGAATLYTTSLPAGPRVVAALKIALPLAAALLMCAVKDARFGWNIVAVVVVLGVMQSHPDTTLYARRTAFGNLRVSINRDRHLTTLFHGTTLHGAQTSRRNATGVVPDRPDVPLSYYHLDSPIAEAIAHQRKARSQLHVAVIGLGVGTLAAYARPGDRWDFIEIDPMVVEVADRSGYFSYLRAARHRGAQVGVYVNDGRLFFASPDPECDATNYDLIVVDAFSSDAVPIHLLTVEAIGLLKRALTSTGVLAYHVSNRFLDLSPVLAAGAADLGLSASSLSSNTLAGVAGTESSDWTFLGAPGAFMPGETTAQAPGRRIRAWTDQFADVFAVLR